MTINLNPDHKLARIAGLLYLILLPTTGPAVFSGKLAVMGDAAATLSKVQAGEATFRLLIAVGAVGFIDYLVLAFLLHRLFSTINKTAAGLMLAFVAISVTLSLAALAGKIDVLYLLNSSPALSVDQLRTQVVLALHSSNNLMQMSIIFWGLWLFPLGWLVFRSGFVPRFLGVMLMLGGFWYLFVFFGTVFDLDYENKTFHAVVGIISGIPGVIGELGTALWLLVMGTRTGMRREKRADSARRGQ